MRSDILFSVIIPVYNAEKYINECIDSILSQSFREYELILVDDGSTDKSLTVCQKYANNDFRIKVFHQENAGVSRARNKGIEIATGSYVLFADADDYYLPDAFQIFMTYLKRSNADAIVSDAIKVGKVDGGRFIGKDYDEFFNDNPIIHIPRHALWGYLLNKEIIDNFNIRFVEGLAYSEDSIFLMNYLLKCKTLQTISQPLYAYRIHPDSVCQSENYIKIVKNQLKAANLIEILRTEGGKNRVQCNFLLSQEQSKRYNALGQLFKTSQLSYKIRILSYYYKERGFFYASREVISYLLFRFFEKYSTKKYFSK